MQKQFKLNNIQKESLKELVERLPEMPYEMIKQIKGSELLEKGIDTIVTTNGNKSDTDPNILYPVLDKVVLVNHYIACKHAFEKRGFTGLFEYLNDVPAHIQNMKVKYPDIFDEEGNCTLDKNFRVIAKIKRTNNLKLVK